MMRESLDLESGSSCPDDARLRRLLDVEVISDAEVCAHLETCGRCRARLEALAGGIHAVEAGFAVAPMPSALDRAMSALRQTPPFAKDSPPVSDGQEWQEILDPPDRVGCLGRFAGYDVFERVGSGGMGIVFKGYDRALQRIVAVKVLSPHLAAAAASRARFLREARAAAAVNHEHVVSIHAVGEHKGLPYLVMQFVSGRSLQERLETDGALGLQQVLRIGVQAAQGLAAAHAQGLIHRDVKPGNILLENSIERVKLTDFGLARAANSPGDTGVGVIAGTPEFMAPEQVKGEQLDARADLFGLGCVLYEMSTGTSPFRAESVPVTWGKVCEYDPPLVSELKPDLPSWFAQLVRSLLAKRREERFGDATDLARVLLVALAQLQTGRGPAEVLVPPRNTPPSSGGRRGKMKAVCFASLVVVAIVAVVFGMNWSQTPFSVVHANGTRTDFYHFAAAVEGTAPGDVLELRWTGHRRVPPIVVTNRPLSLRAGKRGPVIVNESDDQPWLTTDSALSMEGIEVRAAHAASDLAPAVGPWAVREVGAIRRADTPGSWLAKGTQLIVSQGAPLALMNCRLVTSSVAGPGKHAVLLLDCPDARFLNCELFGTGSAVIGWKSTRGREFMTRLQLTNSLVLARAAFHVGFEPGSQAELRLDHCTILGSYLLGSADVVIGLEGEARSTVFSLRRPVNAAAVGSFLGKSRWRGADNVYSHNDAEADFLLPPGDGRSLSIRLGIGGRILEGAEKQRRLVAHDFALSPEEVAKIGHEIGILAGRVGPGSQAR